MSNPRFRFLDLRPAGKYTCESCNNQYVIEIRRYYDMANVLDDRPAVVETSVRTSCQCTPEVDIYAADIYDPQIANLTKGVIY